MELKFKKEILAGALQVVGGVVPSRTPKDILKNTKLVIENGVATLMGTDTEIGMRYQIPEVETGSSGEVLLPTQRLHSKKFRLKNGYMKIFAIGAEKA